MLRDAELVRVVVLLTRIEVGQTGSRRRTGPRFVPPRIPLAAEVLLPGCRDRPGGAIELPLDSRRLDERVRGDDERVRVLVPAVVCVFQAVGRLQPHEVPERRPERAREVLNPGVDAAVRLLLALDEQTVCDADRDRDHLRAGVELSTEHPGLRERDKIDYTP